MYDLGMESDDAGDKRRWLTKAAAEGHTLARYQLGTESDNPAAIGSENARQ